MSIGKFHGHDEPDDADRLAQGEVEAGLADRDRLAEDLVRGPGVVVEDEARAERPRRAPRRSACPTFRLSSRASSSRLVLDQRRRAWPASGRACWPTSSTSPCGSSNARRAASTARSTSSRPPSGAVAIDRARGRVEDLERLAVGGVDELAADDHLRGDLGGRGLRLGGHRSVPRCGWRIGPGRWQAPMIRPVRRRRLRSLHSGGDDAASARGAVPR